MTGASPSRDPIDALVAPGAAVSPLYLVRGERALAEPLAERLSARLAEAWKTEPVRLRHPEDLPRVVEDLRTYSLFSTGKLVVAVETGVLADRAAAEVLLGQVRAEMPWQGGAEELVGRVRGAALRLLQVLRLFDLDPASGDPASVLARLPDSLWSGRGRGRSKRGGAEGRQALEPLLAAAVEAGLRGLGELDASILADLLRDGLPERHALILVESAAPDGHPLIEALSRRGALVEAGRLTLERGGKVGGIDRLLAELERETGAGIRRDAADALTRRTLRTPGGRGAAPGEIDSDSTERLGAEYRKLATLSGGGQITADLVLAHVEDRGEEDVWELLGAVGAGRAGEALTRLARKIAGAEDPLAERLSVFALVSGFARHLVALTGLLAATGVRTGETRYPRFKSELAPRLQGEIAGLAKNPLAGVHPFRLHRAYLAAGRLGPAQAARLPALVLDTELRLKGEGGSPDAALADLLVALSGPVARSERRPAAGSHTRA